MQTDGDLVKQLETKTAEVEALNDALDHAEDELTQAQAELNEAVASHESK
jgi:hypothetical protein